MVNSFCPQDQLQKNLLLVSIGWTESKWWQRCLGKRHRDGQPKSHCCYRLSVQKYRL